MEILRTEVTCSVGLSIQMPSGDWVKVGNQIMSEAKGYPTRPELSDYIKQALDDVTLGCNEQVQMLVDNINGKLAGGK